jgi:SsrA-binding protein
MVNNNIISTNKRSTFDFNIEKTLEVGLELQGWEVKSIRMYGVSLQNTYISIYGNQMFWKEASIKDYIGNKDTKRLRKVLIHKNQLNKWYGETTKNPLTIIPLECYWKNNRYIKLSIGLCSKSNKFDKREKIKQRDIKKQLKDF